MGVEIAEEIHRRPNLVCGPPPRSIAYARLKTGIRCSTERLTTAGPSQLSPVRADAERLAGIVAGGVVIVAELPPDASCTAKR